MKVVRRRCMLLKASIALPSSGSTSLNGDAGAGNALSSMQKVNNGCLTNCMGATHTLTVHSACDG